MSKYTTEVRYICEEAAGLTESTGYDDVENIVNLAYPKIFSNSLVFHNEETKARLLPKILIHYYQREIGFETVGLWKLYLNQRMREILPYYNQLYASEELKYDPLKNVNNQHTHSGEYANDKGGNTTTVENKVENKDNTETRNLTENKDFTETKNNIESRDLTETRNLQTTDDGSVSFEHNEDVILRHTKTTEHDNDEVEHENDETFRDKDIVIHSVDADRDHWVMFSDTPQGGVNGVQLAGGTSTNGTLSDDAYLSNATHETEKPAATRDTTEYGLLTNKIGKVTNKFGDVTETYNKGSDKKDHTDTDGWDKTDNTNIHTGTVGNAGSVVNEGTNKNEGVTLNTGTIINDGVTTNDNISQSNKTENETGTDSYTKTEEGKIGVITYQEMQMKWRESFLNIDMQIINELGDLFMKVW